MNKIFKLFIILCVAVTVTGCTKKMKKKFGITETTPDEFQVTKTSGLDVPPHFKLHNPYANKDDKENKANLSKDEKKLLEDIK